MVIVLECKNVGAKKICIVVAAYVVCVKLSKLLPKQNDLSTFFAFRFCFWCSGNDDPILLVFESIWYKKFTRLNGPGGSFYQFLLKLLKCPFSFWRLLENEILLHRSHWSYFGSVMLDKVTMTVDIFNETTQLVFIVWWKGSKSFLVFLCPFNIR